MASEEIKKIVREYSVYLAKDIPEANCLKNEIANANYDYLMGFFEWVSDRICMVEKHEIKEWVNNLDFVIHNETSRIAMRIGAKAFFGDDIFDLNKDGKCK